MSIEVRNITVGYIKDVPILKRVSIKAEKSKVTVIIGPNGSGKSTLLKTIFGFLKPTEGEIFHNGEKITGLPPHKIIRRGIGYLAQAKSFFPELSILENLELGGWILRTKGDLKKALEAVFDRHPMFEERKQEKAGKLSGGQQRLLELDRSLMTKPNVILLDEPSAGLAPKFVNRIYQDIRDLRDAGFTVLLVDQNVKSALELADYVYVLQLGRISREGPGEELRANINKIIQEWLI